MKLTSIEVSNFLGIKAANVHLDTPICLFAGANYAGKSSLQESIRMALTGESVRVTLKKDYKSIVSDGQKAGFSVVEWEGGQASMILPSGDHTVGVALPAALPYVLDAQRFARLTDNERRAFLFGLMGLSAAGAAVKERLLKRECDPMKVDAIMPTLRAGFDTAHKDAQEKAKESKVAWRTTTGETYGSVKAASFQAKKPEVDTALLAKARADLAATEEGIEAVTTRLGDLQGRARQAAEQHKNLAELREKGSRFARIQDKLNHDQAELTQWEAKVKETQEKAGTVTAKPRTCTCPACGVTLERLSDDALIEYVEPKIKSDPDARAKLPEYDRCLALAQSAVANDKRDLAAAEAAVNAMAEIEKAGVVAPPTEDEMKAAEARLVGFKHTKTNLQAGIRMAEESERAAAAADEKTKKAAAHHTDVEAWTKIAEALAPDGIPGEMLSEALSPINDRLSQSALDSEFARVGIESDMTITAGGRDYALLSESEKWRTNAMIAEAITFLSGVKLLVLDRFDVLDLKGRDDLFAWLDVLVKNGEVDTALIFGTLKSLPATLSEMTAAHWIENGVVGQIEEAA